MPARPRISRPATTFFLIVAALAIAGTRVAAQGSNRLVAVQRFGWEDPTGPAARTTPAQRRLDGGMLTQVVDLAEGRDGALYVLDREACKVVVFEPSGAVRRIIGNGKGEGPGEFVRPGSLALSEQGELFVLDAGRSRVTVFDTSGTLKRTLVIAGSMGFQVRVTRDRLYISQYTFRAGAPVVLVYDHAGTLIDKVYTPTEADVSFGRTGNTYRMTVMHDGKVALAHTNPGTWSSLDAPGSRFGKPLVDENPVQQQDGAWTASAFLRGFGELGTNRMLVLFDRRKPGSTPEHPKVNIFLAVLRPDGTPVETIDVGEVGRNLLGSRDGNSFYLTVAEPSYQVVRFRLAPR